MKLLGAVIAGGASRRFGSDKALAQVGGRPMLDHVIAALRPQVDETVICGRPWPGIASIPDRRGGRIGPLAGLEAALHHAAAQRYDAILSVPVDTLPLPGNLAQLLADAPAVFERQYLIGCWPVAFRDAISAYIDAGGASLHGWIAQARARTIAEPFAITNVNRPTDLAALG